MMIDFLLKKIYKALLCFFFRIQSTKYVLKYIFKTLSCYSIDCTDSSEVEKLPKHVKVKIGSGLDAPVAAAAAILCSKWPVAI